MLRLFKSMAFAGALLAGSAFVMAQDAPAPAPKAKKCTPDGKECKKGKKCKASNCKQEAPEKEEAPE